MSLIVVLSMMIAATVMATAVYYLLNRYEKRSGESLYAESAVAATKAGEASAKAWFTYEGAQALNLVQAYLDECKQTGGCKPFAINMNANYTETANRHGQDFDAYLIGVNADTANVNKPIGVKLEIRGVAQGADGVPSKAVATVIYNLNGMSYQRPPAAKAYATDAIWGRDALFLSGQANSTNFPIKINGGDLYVGGDWEVNGTTTVDSNFVQGISNDETSVQYDITVGGNAFFGSPTKINGKKISIGKNAYFRKVDFSANGSLLIGTDTMTASGGNLWIDSIVKFGPSSPTYPIYVLNKSGANSGNLTVGKYLDFTTSSTIRAMGDIWFKSGGNYSMTAGSPLVIADKDLFFDAACGSQCIKYQYGGQGFYAQGSSGYGATPHWGTSTPAYDGLNPSSLITAADEMTATRTMLQSNSGKKSIPYYLSDSTRLKYQRPWTAWRDTFCTLAGCTGGTNDYLTAANWDKIYDYVSNNRSDLLQGGVGGYLYAVMDSSKAMMWASMSPSGEVSKNYVFYFKSNTSVSLGDKAYGNTKDSRVVWWAKAGFEEIGSQDTIHGVVYSQSGSTKFMGTHFYLKGQIIMADPNANLTGNCGATFWFDDDILSDISEATGLMRVPGTPDSPNPPQSSIPAPWVISMHSPRLDVETVAMNWGPSEVTNWGSLKNFGRSVFIQPGIISFTVGDYTDWNTLSAAKQVTNFVLPDSARTACGVAPTPTSASIANIDFSKPGTYVVQYTASCSDGGGTPSGSLFVWIKPIPVPPISGGTTASSIAPISSSSHATSSMGGISSGSYSSGANAISYEIQTTPTCPTAGLDTRIFLGAKIANNSGVAIDLRDFRVTYFMQSNTPASTWTWVSASSYAPLDTGVVVVNYTDISRNGANPRSASYDYNMMAKITWPHTSIVGSGSFGYFSGLTLNKSNNSGFYAFNDYSYNGCMANWGVNPWVVFERWDGMNWNVVSGTLPPYTTLSSSSTVLSSSAGVSSSSNRKPTGGECYVNLTSVNTGVAVTVSNPTVWTDPDGDSYTLQYNFHNGNSWVSSNSGSWTTAGTYDVTFKAVDSKGLASDTVNCKNSPVKVSAVTLDECGFPGTTPLFTNVSNNTPVTPLPTSTSKNYRFQAMNASGSLPFVCWVTNSSGGKNTSAVTIGSVWFVSGSTSSTPVSLVVPANADQNVTATIKSTFNTNKICVSFTDYSWKTISCKVQ